MSRKNQSTNTVKAREIELTSAKTFALRPLSNGQLPAKLSEDEIRQHISDVEFCIKNATYPGGGELFPHQPQFQTIDRYYPAGHRGKIYIDEPMHADDLEICKMKAAFLRPKGIKYLILTKDCDLQNAMEQLGLE